MKDSDESVEAALRAVPPGHTPQDASRPTLGQHEFSRLLAFREPELENAYLDKMDRANRRAVNGNLLLAIVLLTALSVFDWTSIPKASLGRFEFVRFYMWLPSVAVGWIGNLLIKGSRRSIWWISAISTITVISLAALTHIAGISSVNYLAIFTFQILLFLFFMIGLPFRWSIAIAALACLAQGASIAALHPEPVRLGFALTMLAANFALMIVPAYTIERTSRENFMAQRQLASEYAQRLATEQDRIQWLANIADFFKHELKNSIVGIGQSLALAEQTNLEKDTRIYLDRARRSLDFMRSFLRQASEATTLEAALASHKFESVDLAALVRERVQDYCHERPDRAFEVESGPAIHVNGQPDRLVQMLDKLVNNAIEHSAPPSPVHIQLNTEGNTAVLIVRNLGDSLPPDLDRIFQPFVSGKTGHNGENLGLGLYVARAIVQRHGGDIQVKPLSGPTGAEFVVRLPQAAVRIAA